MTYWTGDAMVQSFI